MSHMSFSNLKSFYDLIINTSISLVLAFGNHLPRQSILFHHRVVSLCDYLSSSQNRPVQLPSSTFINAYLDAFRPHPAPTLPAEPTQADETLDLAFKALEAGDHAHAFTLAGEALSQGITSLEGKAEALNLRGTFK